MLLMLKELEELKKEMERSGISPWCYAIDELPRYEGYCIYDARSVIEVFNFERGIRFEVRSFEDVVLAINYFKKLVFSDPILNSPNAT